MSTAIPKLLVATEFPPNASGGGPAVVRQMLRDWPAARLHWWSCIAEKDARFGQKYAEHLCAPIPSRLMPHRRLTRAKAGLLDLFWVPRAARSLAKTLERIRPDAVWVIPHNWAIPPLHVVLAGGRHRYHITVQDYVDGQALHILGAPRTTRWAQWAEELYRVAETRDATSHPMLDDLRERTGAVGCQMLHAGLEAEDFAFLEEKKTPAGGPIRIAYAGTILVEPEVELFTKALGTLRRDGLPVVLEFFGAHSYRERPWFDAAWMQERGNLAEPELKRQLRACTYGFSPMALADDNPRYNHFSFPTKFITYLAAGLPVITLGHPHSSVMKMATAYGVGPVIATAALEEITAILHRELAAPVPWDRFGPGMVRCARAEFDAGLMRRKLLTCFAGGPPRPLA